MLTALSVARDCNMIEKCDRAVLVHVIPPLDEQPAHIQWMYAEDSNQTVKEVTTHDVNNSIIHCSLLTLTALGSALV